MTRGNAWDIIPKISVEIISPTDLAIEIDEKLDEYFEAGIPQVWIINPGSQIIEVYESRKKVKILGLKDTLTSGEILPGLELPLNQLFRNKATRKET